MSVQVRGNPGEYEREELWQASVRAYHARRGAEMRFAWARFHEEQAARHRATLEALITHHGEAAARLMENGHEEGA